MLVLTLLVPVLLQLGGAGLLQDEGRPPAEARAEGKVKRTLLEEVQADFTAGGTPIHPMLLEQFMPSLKGGPPQVLRFAVATGMHQMTALDPPAPDEYRPDFLLYRWQDGPFNGSMRYDIAGKLDPETFVIRVAANYGGTASILRVLVVRVHLGPKLLEDEPAPVVMTLQRVLPLPGLDATVEIVEPNGIRISRRAREGVPAYERVHRVTPTGSDKDDGGDGGD